MLPDEEAKALQEMAKAAGQAVQAAEKTGGYFGRFLEGPLSQWAGILEDKLRYSRWERQERLMKKAQLFLREMGIEKPTRLLPLNVGVPLLEAATLEEDDELQDIWARLLSNAANADSGVEVRQMLISILKDMGVLEVKLLDAIVNAPQEFIWGNKFVNTLKLPDEYVLGEGGRMAQEPPEGVQVALWNLSRLGCVEPSAGFGGTFVNAAAATPLGRRLVQACTIRSRPGSLYQPE